MFNKIAVFAVAATAFAFATAASAQDCNLKQYASLPMTYVGDGEIGVHVSIAGKDRLFVLDLEAASSALTPAIAQELGLAAITVIPGNNAMVIRIQGQKVARVTHLPEIRIGEAVGKNVAIAVFDQPMKLPNENGVLAVDILSKFDVELDFAKSVLNLYSQDHCPGQVVYWSKTYTDMPFIIDDLETMTFDINLDDKPQKAMLSTTDAPNEMNYFLATASYGVDSPALTLVRDDEKGKTYSYRFKLLTMGDIAVKNPDFIIQDRRLDRSPEALRMGATALDTFKLSHITIALQRNFLKRLHLYFAFGEKTLYITGADAHR